MECVPAPAALSCSMAHRIVPALPSSAALVTTKSAAWTDIPNTIKAAQPSNQVRIDLRIVPRDVAMQSPRRIRAAL
jgi:hypothetical protein